MDFGVTMFPAEYAMDVADLGRETEARGFESLFFPEHIHIPASRKTPSARRARSRIKSRSSACAARSSSAVRSPFSDRSCALRNREATFNSDRTASGSVRAS